MYFCFTAYYNNYNYQWPCYYDYDYYNNCPYQIFPDCCEYNCAPQCYPDYPEIQTENPPIENDCEFTIPGWFEIGGRHIFLGQIEPQLSRFEAEAKAIEAGGKLFEIRSSADNQILDVISKCM